MAKRPKAAGTAASGELEVVQAAPELVLRAPVLHLHPMGQCHGYLYFSASTIRYEPQNHGDHGFSVERSEIEKVGRNRWRASLGKGGSSFEIKTKDQRWMMMPLPGSRDAVLRAANDFPELAQELSATAATAPVADLDPRGPVATPANTPSAAHSETDAVALLHDRNPAREPAHFFEADSEITFNVLDAVFFDPATGELTLAGHRDEKIRGPRIPYLHHLATLLENPRPEFSLEWTPQSEREINRFLASDVLKQNRARASREWTSNLFDRSGAMTSQGKFLFTGLGISPTETGNRAGYLGAEVAYVDGDYVRVAQVSPGSQADKAGLRSGDVIQRVLSGGEWSPINPDEFSRRIRLLGAGAELRLGLSTRTVDLVLGANNADPWRSLDKLDTLATIFRAADMKPLARFSIALAALTRLRGRDQDFLYALNNLGRELGVQAQVEQVHERWQARQISEADANRQKGVLLCSGYDQRLRTGGNAERAFLNTYRGGNTLIQALTACSAAADAQLEVRAGEALDALWSRPGGIHIGPELVEQSFGVRPEVQPVFMGLPGDSLLARAMFEADYTGKRLMDAPELARKLPRYQTGYAYAATHPEWARREATYHMWISVAKLDLAKSPDANTLETRGAKMQFNIREKGRDGRDLPPKSGGYEELLTSLYDDLTVEFPVLHEVREAAKLGAVAQWIRERRPDFRLPEAGRANWAPPSKVRGLIHLYLHPTLEGTRLDTAIIASGGVSLDPFPPGAPKVAINELAATDSSVVDLRGVVSPEPVGAAKLPVLTPRLEQNEALMKRLRVHTIPPEPVAFTRARKGSLALQAVSLRLDRSPACAPSQSKVQQLRAAALRLEQVERQLNMLSGSEAERTSEFERLGEQLTREREEYVEKTLDTLSQYFLDLNGQLPDGALRQTAEGVEEITSFRDKVNGWHERLRSFRSGDPRRVMNDLLALMRESRDELTVRTLGKNARHLKPVMRLVNRGEKMLESSELGLDLLKVALVRDAQVATLDAGRAGEARERLLPLQRQFSDQFDRLRAEPDVQAWLSGTGCNSKQ